MKRIYIDCDGCLTDGTLTIDSNGEKLFKKFHTIDVRAIRELIANGWEVYVVSADDWGGTKHFCNKVGAVFVYEREKENIDIGDCVAVGNDAWDFKMLKKAKLSFCPMDADRIIQNIHGIVRVDKKGGSGIMAEIIRGLKCRNMM